MYIKFCRIYGADKKDEARADLSPQSKLSVELEGEKGKQTEGNILVYRAVCALLALICLVFLVIVIVLGVKLQTGSTVCPETEKTAATDRSSSLESTCSRDQCSAFLADTKPLYRECRQCADGWLTLDESCFFLSTYKLNWEESQKNCTARGGTLAIVNNPTVQNFLTVEGRLKYWIGLKQSNDDWTWVNKTALGQSYWGGTRSSGGCAMLNSNQPADRNWFTGSCQSYTYFICHLHL